uniref:7TM_GPCR_Srx domain-containing protein n=1 Tax=Panagrellus redivivus TaxID=6233 RepID=A0A7E5A0Q7_PANRE
MAVNSVYPGLEMNLGSGIYLGVEVFLYAVHVSVIVVLIAGRKKLFNNCFYTTVTIICIEDVIHYIVVVSSFTLYRYPS